MRTIRFRFRRCLTASLLTAILVLLCSGCGSDDGGTQPTRFGAIEGVVRLPFKLAASGEPIAGVSVFLTSGDFDTVTTTDETGAFFLDQIPARTAQLSAEFGTCLAADGVSAVVRANDTVYAELTLETQSDLDTIPVGWAGAISMELVPGAQRALLLYDAASRSGPPGLVTVDLATGEYTSAEFADLIDVFDLEIINSGLFVINFKSAAGYGLRFGDPVSLSATGEDVPYPSAVGGQSDYDGRLTPGANDEYVFVTHVIREGIKTLGKVYAISVLQRQMIDADDNPFDGEFAFDAGLVENSIFWAYNVAFDDATGEILVGNRTSPFITAIDWDMWGQFDREAGLAVPTAGVRVIDMTPPDNAAPGFGVELWGFAGGHGIAAKSLSGKAPMLHYQSGSESWSDFHMETVIRPAISNHVVKIIPQRQTWFTSFADLDREFSGVITAIEERPLGTLQRLYRYESRFIEDPAPRAFAVDAVAHLLYVIYDNRPILEVFCLP